MRAKLVLKMRGLVSFKLTDSSGHQKCFLRAMIRRVINSQRHILLSCFYHCVSLIKSFNLMYLTIKKMKILKFRYVLVLVLELASHACQLACKNARCVVKVHYLSFNALSILKVYC